MEKYNVNEMVTMSLEKYDELKEIQRNYEAFVNSGFYFRTTYSNGVSLRFELPEALKDKILEEFAERFPNHKICDRPFDGIEVYGFADAPEVPEVEEEVESTSEDMDEMEEEDNE